MAYDNNNQAYEQKDNTGSLFKNPDFNPQGDMDDPKNYWGNGSMLVNGVKMNFTVYAKVAKNTGKPWFKLSLYKPDPSKAKGGQGGQGGQKQSQEAMPPWD